MAAKLFDRLLLALAAITAVIAAVTAPGQIGQVMEEKRGRDNYMKLNGEKAVIESSAQCAVDALEQSMLSINRDYVGWIELPGTGISYPVVRTGNNDDYLRKDFEGNRYTGGSIFMDCRCSPSLEGRNTIIYGHRMNDGSMFSELSEFLERDAAQGAAEVMITAHGRRFRYRIFSASVRSMYSECFSVDFASDYEFETWLARQAEASAVGYCVYPDRTDRILTLVTCHGDGTERCVVQAVLTAIEEAI